jgi:hypothetical protein
MPGIDYSPEPNRPKGMYDFRSPTGPSLHAENSILETQFYVGAITVRFPHLGLISNCWLLTILYSRSTKTKEHSDLHTICKSTTPARRCFPERHLQHCSSSSGTNFLCCTALCVRIFLMVVDGREVCYISYSEVINRSSRVGNANIYLFAL